MGFDTMGQAGADAVPIPFTGFANPLLLRPTGWSCDDRLKGLMIHPIDFFVSFSFAVYDNSVVIELSIMPSSPVQHPPGAPRFPPLE
jgi:hypothetical protein